MGKRIRQTGILHTAAAIIWIFLAASAAAAKMPSATAPATQPGGPQITYVGLFVNDVHGLDLKGSNYTVDFYIWFRWRGWQGGPGLDPSNFEFLNGSLDLKEHPYHIDIGDIHYVSYHCRGVFHIAFDYHRYPLDAHELVLEMEDAVLETRQLQYVVDTENMKQVPVVTLNGWTCGSPRCVVLGHHYKTTFGEPNETPDDGSTYSRFVCSIGIARHSSSIYLKTFLGLFIAVGIAFISFLFKPGEVDPRFAVGVAAIFAAVSSEFVAMSSLPEMPYLTLADKIHLFSLFMIFLSLLLSCLSLRFFREGKAHLSVKVDRISLIAFPASYAIVVMLLTLFA
jgi:hypothetical protein